MDSGKNKRREEMKVLCYDCGNLEIKNKMNACRVCKHIYCVDCFVNFHKHDWGSKAMESLETLLERISK